MASLRNRLVVLPQSACRSFEIPLQLGTLAQSLDGSGCFFDSEACSFSSGFSGLSISDSDTRVIGLDLVIICRGSEEASLWVLITVQNRATPTVVRLLRLRHNKLALRG